MKVIKLLMNKSAMLFLMMCILAYVSEAQGAAPANDMLATAATISGASGSINGNTIDATRQSGEPSHDTSSTLVYRTVWYNWTATESKPVVFEITFADFDPAISLYTSGNAFPLNSITRNNDTFGSYPRIEFGAVAGTTYKIVVGLFNNSSLQGGDFTLQWSTNDNPTNDSFENSLTLQLEAVQTGSVALTRLNATKETGEPMHIAGNKSVWFNFTNELPTDFSITFSTSSFDLMDTTLAVYTGSSVSSLTPIVKNDNVSASTRSRVTFLAKSGVTYRIAVDEGTSPNTGSSLLNWGITKIKGYTDFATLKTDGEVLYDDAADISVFRPSDGTWWIRNSHIGTVSAVQFGLNGDTPVPGDYDGDGRTDIAVARDTPDGKIWYIQNSFDNTYTILQWGLTGDKPVVGDYDFDGRVDLAVFRPGTGVWYVLKSSDGNFIIKEFGLSNDIPVSGDFKGTPLGTDIAVFRPSNGTWYILNTDHTIFIPFGILGDKPVVADYDADGKSDTAVYRPSEGIWYVLRSRTGQIQTVQWGFPDDIPMTGDYDNNANDLDDFAVYRPSDGTWYILKAEGTQTQFTQFGLGSDTPISSLVLLSQ